MRRVVSGTLSLLAVAAFVCAEPPNKAAVEKTVLANETAINEAVAKGDLAAFNKLVGPDAWSIDQTGLSTVADFTKMFGQVKVEPGWKIDASKVIWIDDGTVVHFYHWSGKGSLGGQRFGDSFASTVWANRGGKWVPLVHHETPAATPTAGPTTQK